MDVQRQLQRFIDSLDDTAPPEAMSTPLRALWWAGKSDWHQAHDQVDTASGRDEAWVHAHLHRREGDLGNAGYWYRRAERPVATTSLDEEWHEIAEYLLSHERAAPRGRDA
ncbi:hypothetical protein C7446_0124 [Kushneria sinocarnis]|uniref:Uncharacterized protein n=1 Tax=Kushneria sinocarnis TaxID=595502 RepID=A0A420X0E2_9GAMM|nr:hypothetical protein [Kushneria sinocarnis]RKR07313.1 hypothetical protein C7446_0124 [Kushneria sinocarnis]